MNENNIKLSILLLLIIVTSCTKMALKASGVIGYSPILQKIEMKGKDVLFLGMIHLNKQEFYIKSKKMIDSLSSNGYYIFGEGTEDSLIFKPSERSSVKYQENIVLKKIRKIMNQTISESQILYYAKLMKKYELKIQPKDLYFFNDTTKSITTDISITQKVRAYEKIKGEIKLDSCDINTKVGDEYRCKKLDRKERTFFRNEIIIKLRNNLVIDAVKKSNKKKILIIYGKNHFEGIKNGLEENILTNKK